MTAAAEPVVGAYGLRTFGVSEEGYLSPVTSRGSAFSWITGTCTAVCALGKEHAPPADGCTCGVYSFKSVAELRRQYPSAAYVIGVVALEGETVEGAKGYRSAAARVVALWFGPGCDRAGAVAARYPDAAVHTTAEQLTSGFSGLSVGDDNGGSARSFREAFALNSTKLFLVLVAVWVLALFATTVTVLVTTLARSHDVVRQSAVAAAVASQLHASVPPGNTHLMPGRTNRSETTVLTVGGVSYPCSLTVTSARPVRVEASCNGVKLPATRSKVEHGD